MWSRRFVTAMKEKVRVEASRSTSSAPRQADTQRDLESHGLLVDLCGLERPITQRFDKRYIDLRVGRLLHRYLLQLTREVENRRCNDQLMRALRCQRST